MADAEHPAGQLGQAGAQRDVELLQRDAAEVVGILAFGHEDGGQRRGIVFRLAAEDFEAPGGDGAAGRLGVAVVAGEELPHAPLIPQLGWSATGLRLGGTGRTEDRWGWKRRRV